MTSLEAILILNFPRQQPELTGNLRMDRGDLQGQEESRFVLG
jgi:hypothetical protein